MDEVFCFMIDPLLVEKSRFAFGNATSLGPLIHIM